MIEATGWVPLPVGDLAVVVATPTDGPVRGSVLLAPAAGFGPGAGRNAIVTRMVRRLAADGWMAYRFDYVGCGNSGPGPAAFDLASPPAEQVSQLVTALDPPRPRHAVGICFGGRVLLAALPELADLERLLLLSVPMGDLAGGARPASLLSGLDAAEAAGVRITCGAGSADASARTLSEALARSPELARLEPGMRLIDGPLDGFPTAASQDRAVALVRDWADAPAEARR